MNEQVNEFFAACGLDCESCEIRRVPFDVEAAGVVLKWFRTQGWLKDEEGVREVLSRSMYCKGCHGDRSIHWSADCWILKCCVDEKGLRTCAQCASFPCPRLVEWSSQNDSYKKAFQRLKEANRG